VRRLERSLLGSLWLSRYSDQASGRTTEMRNMYRGADKSLARPGRKQATATRFCSCILFIIIMVGILVLYIYIYIYIFVCVCVCVCVCVFS
jgi:Flp pilus assembly protein TadB